MLLVVATPIGNLSDITYRAVEVLRSADVILCEDTRVTQRLCQHYQVGTRLVAYHEHNELQMVPKVLDWLVAGQDVVLVGDAGTPLMSDPGYQLVVAARLAGIDVVPIPGVSACIAALSVAGLPTDRFAFWGFLPAKAVACEQVLAEASQCDYTVVVYESTHRIVRTVALMQGVLGADREVVLAKELTKSYESVVKGTVVEVQDWLLADPGRVKGEFVLLISPLVRGVVDVEDVTLSVDGLLRASRGVMGDKAASKFVAGLTGMRAKVLYQRLIDTSV